jgi:hypothetical protein
MEAQRSADLEGMQAWRQSSRGRKDMEAQRSADLEVM